MHAGSDHLACIIYRLFAYSSGIIYCHLFASLANIAKSKLGLCLHLISDWCVLFIDCLPNQAV
jgi:hypothetical protein